MKDTDVSILSAVESKIQLEIWNPITIQFDYE